MPWWPFAGTLHTPMLQTAIRSALATMVIAMTVSACDRSDASLRDNGEPEVSTIEAATIDSIIPLEESLRRFRVGLAVTTSLQHAMPSRDSLVGALLASIARNDSVALGNMTVNRAEYAYLYYPTSVYARKPYQLAPDIAWMLNAQNNDKGLTRLLARYGGRVLTPKRYECRTLTTETANRHARDCSVTFTDQSNGKVLTQRLFGSIMERDGKFKVLSFANDF